MSAPSQLGPIEDPDQRARLSGQEPATSSPLRRRIRPATSSRFPVLLIFGPLVVLVATAVVVTASAPHAHPSSKVTAGISKQVQPPPTKTPDAPAITIATSPQQDLSGAWIMQDGDRYLMFTSNAFGNLNVNLPELSGLPGHWSAAIDALPRVPPWASSTSLSGVTWQPEVHRFGSTYVLYYAAEIQGSNPPTRCLATAASRTAVGPYSPSPRPIVCQLDQGGDIDPQVVVEDTRGRSGAYLIWKSDNNSAPDHGTDLIWAQPLAGNGLSLVGTPKVIYGTDVAPAWAQPFVEAPQMVESPLGGWWLFYSGGGGFYSPDYSIGAARCASISGPCTAVGSEPLITNNAQDSGAGEETLFVAEGTYWLLYSPWHSLIPYQWFRPVVAARIGWSPAGPYVAEASQFPLPSPAPRRPGDAGSPRQVVTPRRNRSPKK